MPTIVDVLNLCRTRVPAIQHAWLWVSGWLFYILPAFSNLVLVLLGVVLSLPTLAEKVEKTPKYKKALGAVCLAAGFVGFWFDVAERRSNDQQITTLVANVGVLVTNTNTLANNTSVTVTNIGLLLLQVNFLNSRITNLENDIKAAKGNPRLIASLLAEIQAARTQEEAATRQTLLAMVSGVADQLVFLGRSWYLEEGHHSVDQQFRSDLAKGYMERVAPLMVTADNLRQQLLKQLPSAQTEEDKSEVAIFAKAMAGRTTEPLEIQRIADYLHDLSRRVRQRGDDSHQ